MIEINDELDCCGINEIRSIGDNKNNPEQTIIDICSETYTSGKKGAFLMFTDINKKIAAKNLSKYILKNKLGTITKSPTSINPNSKNRLQVFIWTINKRNLKRFAKEHNIKDNDDNNFYD
jgi:hypothetical protein